MEKNDGLYVKKLTPYDVAKSNPKIYWGSENPTYDVINKSILSQLNEENCRGLKIDEIYGWHVISSDTNWFSLAERSADDLFDNALGYPGGGGNGLRFEYFLKIIACNVCVFERNHLYRIKGKIDDSLSLELTNTFENKTCVAYKL